MTTPLPTLSFLVLLALPTTAQQTWTVDDDQPADFVEIQDAIDFASDGDTVLVSPGVYDQFLIDGKGLTIVSNTSAMAINAVSGTDPVVEVANLGPGQHVVLEGLVVFNGSNFSPAALRISNCQGPVWLQHLFIDSYGAQSAHVSASSSVVFVDTLGQTNLTTPLPDGTPVPGPGIRVEGGSFVYAYGSDFTGSHGAFVFGEPLILTSAPDGGPGGLVEDSYLLLSDTTLTGGSGSTLLLDGCTEAGDGGDGVELRSAGGTPPLLEMRDAVVGAGFPGFFDPACATPPSMGTVFDIQAGSAIDAPGTSRTLTVPGLATAGGSVDIDLVGQAGDVAFLFASGSPVPALGILGVESHLSLPSVLQVTSVVLGGGGVEEVSLTLPGLPAGATSVTFALQALFVDGSSALRVSGPTALTLD